MVGRLLEGVGDAGWRQRGKNWDNCNNTMSKIYFKKLWYIYTMEYYAADRKKELLPFTTA